MLADFLRIVKTQSNFFAPSIFFYNFIMEIQHPIIAYYPGIPRSPGLSSSHLPEDPL